MRTVRSLLACLLALSLAPAAQGAEKRLEAGAGTADITPAIGTPMFAYTDRSRVFNPANNADLLNVLADPDHGLHAKTFVGSPRRPRPPSAARASAPA